MVDQNHFKAIIINRMQELGMRVKDIEKEFGHQLDKDLSEQAIDLEDDEMLESLSIAAEKELAYLKAAMGRIEDGTFGTCLQCNDPISEARLEAVPYAPLCKTCATEATR